MLNKADIAVSAEKLKVQIVKLSNPDHMVDNLDWFGQIGMLEFMRDVACYFSVNQLTSMETFSTRLREQKHLSAMEFYYPLLQAYDFKYLFEQYQCNVQLGGSDQWGNITQGIGFVSRTTKQEVFGLVADLLVNSNGEKMGKSVSGAIYLDDKLCSPYDFWQFWRNVSDDHVERFMLQLTSFTEDEIKLKLSNITDAKKALADSITTWVHGAENAIAARTKSEMIFEKNVYETLETVQCEHAIDLEKVLVKVGFATSFGEAKRTIESGAIYVNDTKILSPKFKLDPGEYVIRYGKKRYMRVLVG